MDRTQQGGMTRSQLGFFSIVGEQQELCIVTLAQCLILLIDSISLLALPTLFDSFVTLQ